MSSRPKPFVTEDDNSELLGLHRKSVARLNFFTGELNVHQVAFLVQFRTPREFNCKTMR